MVHAYELLVFHSMTWVVLAKSYPFAAITPKDSYTHTSRLQTLQEIDVSGFRTSLRLRRRRAT